MHNTFNISAVFFRRSLPAIKIVEIWPVRQSKTEIVLMIRLIRRYICLFMHASLTAFRTYRLRIPLGWLDARTGFKLTYSFASISNKSKGRRFAFREKFNCTCYYKQQFLRTAKAKWESLYQASIVNGGTTSTRGRPAFAQIRTLWADSGKIGYHLGRQ